MKRIVYYILLAGLLLSCEDFLTNKEKDKVIPTLAVHFKELVYGDLIHSTEDIYMLAVGDVMSDDVSVRYREGAPAPDVEWPYAYYLWQPEPEYNLNGDLLPDKRYYELYHDILLCNSIESLLPGVTDDPELVANIYGEIYFIRALSYYLLAGFYGYPYVDEASSHHTLCVPLNTEIGVMNKFYQRATQRAVYDQMERDIEQSLEYFKSSVIPATMYRPNLKAAQILATRIFLTEKKYDRVIAYADELNESFENMYDLNTLYADNGGQIESIGGSSDKTTFFNKANKEIVYSYGHYTYSLFQYDFVPPLKLLSSDSVVKGYDENDLRSKIFFDTKGVPCKIRETDGNLHGLAFRVTEALLNRAEAYLMSGNEEAAIADLNKLREKRFKTGTDFRVKTGEELTRIAREERRHEFCFEGQRWFDLRRWGSPALTHYYFDDNSRKLLYRLEPDDVAYTLPIPREEQLRNPLIELIVRPSREGTTAN